MSLPPSLGYAQLPVVPPASTLPAFSIVHKMVAGGGCLSRDTHPVPAPCCLGSVTLHLFMVESSISTGWAVLCLGLPPELPVSSPSWPLELQLPTVAGVTGRCNSTQLSTLLPCVHRSPGVPLPSACPVLFPGITASGRHPGK